MIFFQHITVQIQAEPPFSLVGSFQLKFCPFPVLVLYFFTCPTPCHPSFLSAPADTPLRTFPSQLNSRLPPGQQLPLKSCTIGKNLFSYISIYLPLHIHHIKTTPGHKTTTNILCYPFMVSNWYTLLLLTKITFSRQFWLLIYFYRVWERTDT